MNYLIQPRRDALAAEYVLGTLRGAARKRFQGLILQYPDLRHSVEQWEKHINALVSQIQPVAPDPVVWEKIKRRLAFSDGHLISPQLQDTNVVTFPEKEVSRWKTISLLASAAAVVLAVLLVQLQPIEPEPAQQFTVMQNEAKESLWLIEITAKTIDAYASKNVSQRQQNDYQLWMLAEDGRPPISLGLLPQTGLVSLSKHPEFDQLDIAALAVSLEPLGGSPNGSPTEVLYVAQLAVL